MMTSGFPFWVLLLLTMRGFHCQTVHTLACDETFDRENVNSACTISNLHVDYVDTFNLAGFNYTFNDYNNVRTNYKNQIEKLDFKDSILNTFPVEIFSTFVNLNDFSARDCNISEVCRHFFKNAGELMKIDLSGNRITRLPNVAFMGAEKVQTLDLSLNRISDIQASAFYGLPHLGNLKLSYNQITRIVKEYFPDCYYLDKLYLDHNRIEVLNADTFSRCSNLRYLWLNDNQLRILDDLVNVGQIRYVDLRANQLESLNWRKTLVRTLDVTNNSLTSIFIPRTMEYLYASSNHISKVEILETASVWEMNLSKNNITDLVNVTKITSIGILDLSFNNIGALNLSTFAHLAELTTLNLESTNLTNINYGTFSHLTKIKTLDISYNSLSNLDMHMMSAMTGMINFYVDGNDLTELDFEHLHTYFSNLTFIGLSDNRFNCTYLSQMVNRLTAMNVSIFMEPDNLVTNQPNVKGIGCGNSENKNKSVHISPHRHIQLLDTTLDEVAKNETENALMWTHHYKVYKEEDEPAVQNSGVSTVLLVMNMVLVVIVVGFFVTKVTYYIKKRRSSGIISFNTRSNSVLTIEQNI